MKFRRTSFEREILAAIDDLNNAVTQLTAAVTAAVADKGTSVSAADVETAVSNINAQTTALTTAFPAPPA